MVGVHKLGYSVSHFASILAPVWPTGRCPQSAQRRSTFWHTPWLTPFRPHTPLCFSSADQPWSSWHASYGRVEHLVVFARSGLASVADRLLLQYAILQ